MKRRLGGRDIDVDEIQRYQEQDKLKHTNRYVEEFTKSDIRRFRNEIRDGTRESFPRGTWDVPQNIEYAAQITIDDAKRNYGKHKKCPECKRDLPKYFIYPSGKGIANSGFSCALKKVKSILNFYKTAGCFDASSNYYDPILETFPQIVMDCVGMEKFRMTPDVADEINLENAIRINNSFSITAAKIGKYEGDLTEAELLENNCKCLFGGVENNSITCAKRQVGLNSTRNPKSHWVKDNFRNTWEELSDAISKSDCYDSTGRLNVSKIKSEKINTVWAVVSKYRLWDMVREKFGPTVNKRKGHWDKQENRFEFYSELEDSGKKVTTITAKIPYQAILIRGNINWSDELNQYNIWKNERNQNS